MFLSLVMFGFLGGISGVVMGTEQINLIMHNTLYVPGHFHATVVAGTTLAFMAITYLARAADLPSRGHVQEDRPAGSPTCSGSASPASRCS